MPHPPTLTGTDIMPRPPTLTRAGADAGACPYSGALPLLLYTPLNTTLPYRRLHLSMAVRR